MLASCAGPRPPAPIAEAPPAPPEHIDGQYRGIARLIRAAVRGCPRSGPRTIMVEGSALSVNYRGPTVSYALAATVAPDGSIQGSDGRGAVQGQITGRHMDLTVTSDACDVRYALERR